MRHWIDIFMRFFTAARRRQLASALMVLAHGEMAYFGYRSVEDGHYGLFLASLGAWVALVVAALLVTPRR